MVWIAIDGVAGAGKSVLGVWLAQQLQYRYLDTGLFYRAFAWVCLRSQVGADDVTSIHRLLEQFCCEFITNTPHQLKINNDTIINQAVLYQARVTTATARFARLASVRRRLTAYFRQLVVGHNYVVVGRDIGSQVLPDARVKLFITARPEVRAQRRMQQHAQPSALTNYRRVMRMIQDRDHQDVNRSLAPLQPTADSIIFDNSDLELSQAQVKLLKLVQSVVAPPNSAD